MEGRVLLLRTIPMRQRLTALAACSMIVTLLPLPAAAEYGIQPGSGAVVTAGQPLTVRTAPGWDAPVSYDIADGSWVTVGGEALAAPDGSMWYPVDGGFVPVDGVSSAASADNSFAYFQTATDDTWTDPNAVPLDTSGGWTDPTTGEWVTADVATDQWVDPNAGQEVSGWIDPNTGEWVDATQQAAADTWVDPNAATDAWVDPNVATDQWVDPNAATDTWVDPNAAAPTDVAVDAWVDPNAAVDGWIDPNTGEWVTSDAAVDGWIDPNTGEWVTAAPQELAAAPTDTWVDPNAATAAAPSNGYVDPVTGEWVVTMAQDAVTDPAAEQYVEPVVEAPATTDQTWVDPNAVPATDGSWVDPNTATTTDGAWVDPNAPVATDVVAQPDLSGVPATDEWVEPAPQAPVADNSYGAPIGTAYIAGTNGDGVACRVAAERGSDKVATLGEGEAVEVRGEAIGEWQPVNCAGMGGYVNTAFISWEPVAAPVEVAQKGGGKNRNRGNAGVDGTATASGQSMVNFAMQYVGYPYAYAGEGPYAFDCSGFTKFVAQNTLGMDITHDMFTQIGMGSSVDRGGLVPGDLVFFANTFRPGLSHTGIYIGDGQFVHAENESTGVVVSDLNSDYYSSRWYGATRLA
jgi:cell wall-associated NlpC family hydrolase